MNYKKTLAVLLSVAMLSGFTCQFTATSYAKKDAKQSIEDYDDGSVIIEFDDKTFEYILSRQFMSRPSYIDRDSAERLDSFWCASSHLESLTDLRHIEDITKMVLRNTSNIDDFSPIGNLEYLSQLFLQLGNCKTAKSLSFLSKLEYLQMVTLSNMNITELPDLSALHHLEYLDLSYNNISDISAISSLKKLKKLVLTKNNITDLSPILNLDNLEELIIDGNPVTNLSAIKNLTNLTTLNLDNCDFKTINGLENAKKLTNLSMKNINKDLDLSPLLALENLEYLDLSNNSNLDFSALKNASFSDSLEDLIVKNSALEDLDFISEFNLKVLDISKNKIKSLASIKSNSGISNLCASNNEITSLEGLDSLKKLFTLNLSSNKINLNSENLDILANCSFVRFLDLSHNLISSDNLDLSALKHNPDKLFRLNLSNNDISSLILPELSNLDRLNLENNNMETLKLSKLLSLSELYLNNNPLTLLEFSELPRLSFAKLNNTALKTIPDFRSTSKGLFGLTLDDNTFESLEPLNNYKLAYLSLNNTKIINTPSSKKFTLPRANILYLKNSNLTDLSFLAYPFGTFLDISGSNIDIKSIPENITFDSIKADNLGLTSLDDIPHLEEIRFLSAKSNKLTSVSFEFYDSNKTLEFLDLSDNEISEIKHLDNLEDLEQLYLSKNKLTAIPDLKNIPRLEYLALNYNQISGIDGLKTLSPIVNLSLLNLSHNNIKDINTLSETDARMLFLNDNNIEDASIINSLDFLHKVNLDNNPVNFVSEKTTLDENSWRDMFYDMMTPDITPYISDYTPFSQSFNFDSDRFSPGDIIFE